MAPRSIFSAPQRETADAAGPTATSGASPIATLTACCTAVRTTCAASGCSSATAWVKTSWTAAWTIAAPFAARKRCKASRRKRAPCQPRRGESRVGERESAAPPCARRISESCSPSLNPARRMLSGSSFFCSACTRASSAPSACSRCCMSMRTSSARPGVHCRMWATAWRVERSAFSSASSAARRWLSSSANRFSSACQSKS